MNKTGQPVKIKSGLIFVVKTIPILALQGKIRETGDLKHIVKLVPRGVTHPMASTLQDLVTSEPGTWFIWRLAISSHFTVQFEISKARPARKT
jgi:hypothetical protein